MLKIWKYRHSVKENPKSGYTIDRQPGSGRPRSVCVSENTENVKDLVLSQEDNPKTHRSIREIKCETGIHRLNVHKIIHRDLQLKCVYRRRAQQLSETTRRPSDSPQAAGKDVWYSWLHMVYGWKSVYRQTTTQLAERSGLCAKKRHIDPSRLLRTSAMVSVAVSQMGMTELIFVNPGVNVRPLLLQCRAVSAGASSNQTWSVAERCLFTKQYVAYGEILSFFVFCDFPR